MKVKAYMCWTDWAIELKNGQEAYVYTDLKKLKTDRTCYKECGIVQVDIIKKKCILKGTR